jgi:hypothetical protein
MLVIIAIIMILTDQCAGGAFVCFHPDCYMSPSLSSLLLEHSSVHRSNKNARGCTEDCPWLTPTNSDSMGCNDGFTCDTPSLFSCCNERGGRAKCPLRSPLMCAQPNACQGGSDYCCETNCDTYGGIRQCGELISGDTPCILETEFESKV